MRLLHVVASGQRRGAEVFASDLVGALGGAGVSQWIAVLRGPMLIDYRTEVAMLRGGGRMVPGLRVSLPAVGALRELIGDWRPDVIQAHGGEPFKYSVLATGRRTPVVYRRIGQAPPWLTRGPRRVAHTGLMRRAAGVVAVAEAVRRETVELFRLPPKQVVTIPNGVDPRRIEPSGGREAARRTLGIPPGATVVLSLGALTWEKDPLAQLEVVGRVLRERLATFHVIAGDGPLRGAVEEGIRRHGLDDRVLLLGARADVADLLAASDVLLFTSRDDGMEGMPAVLIEAGMAGLPVVAYAVAGVTEVIAHRTTGLLTRPGDLEGLTDCMRDLLEDAGTRRDLGEAARRRCLSRFDISAVAPRYLDLYEGLIRSAAGAIASSSKRPGPDVHVTAPTDRLT